MKAWIRSNAGVVAPAAGAATEMMAGTRPSGTNVWLTFRGRSMVAQRVLLVVMFGDPLPS